MKTNRSSWLRKILASFAFLALAALASGMTYEAIERMSDDRRFPARGRMVDVGGYRLNINCTGSGSPTVILESGLGEPARSWAAVQSGAERFTRVCSYDRAGYGWSDPGPEPRSSLRIARELHTLLVNSGMPGPYVLVGHSFGGFNVRVFTGLYPSEVAGMVMVDSSHEDQERFQAPSLRRGADRLERMAPFVPLLRFFGVLRLRAKLQPDNGAVSRLPDAAMQEISALALRPHSLTTFLQEYALFGSESASEVRAAGDLGDLPLIVLTAGQPANPPDPDVFRFRKAWVEQLQPSLRRLSRQGTQLLLEHSDHMIPYRDPDAIVQAIHTVWLVRKNGE
jgi:pimeloyl-ACP methyl ester carboxylesterase